MTYKIDGKQLSVEIEERLKEEILIGLKNVRRKPGLAVVRVGDDPASEVYVSNKERACKRVGIDSFLIHLSENSSSEEISKQISNLNNREEIDGILMQLPLPKTIDHVPLLQKIDPDKDVDGLHSLNLGKLVKGEYGPRSCTPAGIIALLKRNDISISGKRVVVVGRSILVGKPMALMFQDADATVTVAHSKTKNLSELTSQAEILVVAAGKPEFIGLEHVKKNAVVIDVGIHRIPEQNNINSQKSYRLCGDVKTDEIFSKVKAITPVPGGVGPMTVAMLLVNTVASWQYHCGLSFSLGNLLP